MDLETWWAEATVFWGSTEGQTVFREVVLPAAAILVSTIIAVIVLASQLRAARRQHRSDRIAQVIERLSEVKVQAHLRHEAAKRGVVDDNPLEAAMRHFDASISALRFALPKRQRAVPDFVREMLYTAFFDTDTFLILARADRASTYFESWVLGNLPARKFKAYNKYSSGPSRGPTSLRELWAELKERDKIGYDHEGGPDAYARYKRSRRYRVVRRRARFHYGWRAVLIQHWWELRNPSKAPEYREARRRMRRAED